jgi:MFS family permease
MVYGITVFAFRPLVGKMLDRYGDNIVMMPSIAFYTASLAVLALAGQQFALLLAAFIMGLGYSNAVNMGQAIAVRQAPPHRIAAATSTVLVAIDSGQGIGPIIMGFIKTHSDFHTMYFVEFIIAALCIPLYFLLHGRRRQTKLL